MQRESFDEGWWFSLTNLYLYFFFFILTILYLGIGAYPAVTMTKVGEHPQYDQDPGSFGLEYETVYFTSRGDKLKLAAWYIPQAALVLFDEGSHAELFRDNPGEYMSTLRAFFQDKWGC